MEDTHSITTKGNLDRSSRRSSKILTAIQAAKLKMKGRLKADLEGVIDDYSVAEIVKELIKGKTGVTLDDFMTEHYCLWDEGYPECPDRYISVKKRCQDLGLLDLCYKIPSKQASQDDILKMHNPDLLAILRSTEIEIEQGKLEQLSSRYDAIYFNNSTYTASLLSAGCAMNLVSEIILGEIQNGMAIIRPPGHHAMENEFNGYCFFNNVALAATRALEMNLSRILIVDWDVHHGQGTQRMFYNDNKVLYFSIHRYEKGLFWPNLRESDFDHIGEGVGEGYNFNVPLNQTGLGDADYLAIFQQVLLPVAYEYQPELVIVSAGYDCAIGCPEYNPELVIISAGYDCALGDEKGEMKVTPACFAHLTSSLMGLASGKVAVVLEGGYCLKSLAEGAALTLRALLGFPAPLLQQFGIPCQSTVDSILNTIYTHRNHWRSLRLQDVADASKSPRDFHIPQVLYLWKHSRPSAFETRNCYPVQPYLIKKENDDLLNELQRSTVLISKRTVGLVLDMVMMDHKCSVTSNHREKPERIKEVMERFEDFAITERCVSIEARKATDEELLMVHSAAYVNDIKNLPNQPQHLLDAMAAKYESVYLTPQTYESAAFAAGSLVELTQRVIKGKVSSGVAIIRPPGHHADQNTPSGFCIFNNAAVAAAVAIHKHGLKRVVILDWDVHHGNGTQAIFEDNPNVLYISIHRYNNARFFPGKSDAGYDNVGKGPGIGFNINIPWNKPGNEITDGDYIAAFHAIILPVLYHYNPELIIVSAGFDACVNDPLGNCKVTPQAFAHMTHWLLPLAQGKLILALEGGYNITSLSYAITLCTKALLGDPLPSLGARTTVPSDGAIETIRNVIRTHVHYWPCLAFNKLLPSNNVLGQQSLSKAEKEAMNENVLSGAVEGIHCHPNSSEKGGGQSGGRPEAESSKSEQTAGASTSAGTSSTSAGTKSGTSTLEEYLMENLMALKNEEMFAVVPRMVCPHLDQVAPVPEGGIDIKGPCNTCENTLENWACLSCYEIFCGRYINGHMVEHADEATHPLVISFSDLSVWCYACEAYIDNAVLYPAKNDLHKKKFNEELVWSYGPQLSALSANNES